MKPAKVVVVGAGPAGCAAALRLARIPNVSVQVLEKRTLGAFMAAADSPLAYPMVLSNRALGTLDDMDLSLPSTSSPYDGICFLPSRSIMRSGDESSLRLVSRQQLSLDLLRAASELPNISMHFGVVPDSLDTLHRRIHLNREHAEACTHDASALVADLSSPLVAESGGESQQLRASTNGATNGATDGVTKGSPAAPATVLRQQSSNVSAGLSTQLAVSAKSIATGDPSGAVLPDELGFDLLVAADGRNSSVRGMLARLGQIETERAFTSSANMYKTFTDVQIPAGADGDAFPFAAPDVQPRRNLYFIESQSKDVSLKVVMWRSDADHLCGMIPGDTPHVTNTDLASFQAAFKGRLPEWLLCQVAEQCGAQEPHQFGSIETCNQYHGEGGVVLIGDAAHAVTSSLGQGCNMALQSVRVLGDIADGCAREGSLGGVPARFTEKWMPDAKAMQRLELMNVLLKSKGGEIVGMPGVSEAHSKVAMGSAMLFGMAQWKLMPDTYSTIPMFGMLYDSQYKYRDVEAYVSRAATACYCVLLVIALSIGSNLVDVVAP